MRPIDVRSDGFIGQELQEGERLVALTADDINRLRAGLDSSGMMLERDIRLSAVGGHCKRQLDQRELDEVQALGQEVCSLQVEMPTYSE